MRSLTFAAAQHQFHSLINASRVPCKLVIEILSRVSSSADVSFISAVTYDYAVQARLCKFVLCHALPHDQHYERGREGHHEALELAVIPDVSITGGG